MKSLPVFSEMRSAFQDALLANILTIDKTGIPSNADRHSTSSVRIAQGLLELLGPSTKKAKLKGQMAGRQFEEIVCAFLQQTFPMLDHLRPGRWLIEKIGGGKRNEIVAYDQYAHLVALQKAARNDPELAAALGSDYLIAPDIVIARWPEPDEVINRPRVLVDSDCGQWACLRESNNARPILHASISCKWTIRSDRVQNARAEGLNLVRNRKGHTPHIAVVIGEPLPSRIASIALGTGDIDCVYHVALPELIQAASEADLEDSGEMIRIMVDGKRLKDISDLPLDLAV